MRQRPGPRKTEYLCDLRVLYGEALLSVNVHGTIIALFTEMDMTDAKRLVRYDDLEVEQACLR
jgi:hypothetical protein